MFDKKLQVFTIKIKKIIIFFHSLKERLKMCAKFYIKIKNKFMT